MNTKVETLSELVPGSKSSRGDNVALCYGHFNAIHPGHLRYFRKAKDSADKLLIAVEGDKQLSELERGINFSESDRAQAVAALDIVDGVVIMDSGRLEDLVKIVRPEFLFLGKEFENRRATRVVDAVELVRKSGGKVVYDSGETHYATSDFLYGDQSNLENERWAQYFTALANQNIEFTSVLDGLLDSPSPRILVVGDSIVDRYVACDPIGMSNEAPVIVVKEIESMDYVGGAGIVAAHVVGLRANCVFVSVSGADAQAEYLESQLKEYGVDPRIIPDEDRPTTFKIRYMVESQKLFRVSRLKEHSIPREIEDQVIEKIVEMGPVIDGIIVCDFVYGMITDRILEVVHEVSDKYKLSLFGDLQCSSQVGNVTKFKNFSLICPTEREARIALGNQDDGVEFISNILMEKTQSKNLILKLGADGFIAYTREESGDIIRKQHFPALSVSPVDVTGAGDSLLAAVAVAMTHGMTLMEASALGCCVSALSVQTVGNYPASLESVKKYFYSKSIEL